jgi:hypothetical protein
MVFDIASELARFGVAKSEILFLRPDSPSIVPFLDLAPSLRRPVLADDLWPEAVIQGPFGPIAYVVRNDQLNIDPGRREQQMRRLQRRLVSRGAGTMLAVVSRSKLEVLPLGAGYATAPVTEVFARSPAPAFFRELATGSLPAPLVRRNGWYSADWSTAWTLAQLIVRATRRIEKNLANSEDSLMLVARVIMMRLMRDRGLVAPAVRQAFLGESAFETLGSAVRSNQWFDRQFSGEMLGLRHRNPGSVAAYVDRLSAGDRQDVLATLAELFVWPGLAGAPPHSSSNIDFSCIRPIVVAEAFEQGIATLELPADSRRAPHYTPSELATFMAEEAIRSHDGAQSILTNSSDCGQVLIAALEELVYRQWERSGRRPSRTKVEQLMTTQLRGIPGKNGRAQLSAALLSLAALDLSADTFPLDSPFPSPADSVFSRVAANGTFDIVIGDHVNDHDHGRRAFEQATASTTYGGVLALCIGNRVLRATGARLPPGLRNRIRLAGIVTDVKRVDRKTPVDVVFARNQPPDEDAEFWLASPFEHRHRVPFVPSWIDASRTHPISQSLVNEIPGLLVALPRITLLEAGVLIRLWRNLATPPMSLELEDPALQAFCATLIADSLVGQFVRAVLGDSTHRSVTLPTASLAGLTRPVRTEAMNVASGDGSKEARQRALVEQLCGVDASDFGIMAQYVLELDPPTMSMGDFGSELTSRLRPYFEGRDVQVSPFSENAGYDFHLFSIGHTRRSQTDHDWAVIYETLASGPVSSLTIMPNNGGGLLLWISGRRLTASLAWIVALDVLRNHADDIDDGELWQSDSA